MRSAIVKCTGKSIIGSRFTSRGFGSLLEKSTRASENNLCNPSPYLSQMPGTNKIQPLTANSKLTSLLQSNDQVMILGCDANSHQNHLSELVEVLTRQNNFQSRKNLGLLIITSSRDQSADIYAKLKQADESKTLSIARFGSASYMAPHITTEDKKRKDEHHQLNQTSIDNLTKIAETEGLDILVATLWEASILSPLSEAFKPEFTMLQDFELLFDENHTLVERVLYCLDPASKKVWTSRNPKPELPGRFIRWLPEPTNSSATNEACISHVGLELNQTVGKKTKMCKVIDTVRKNANKRGVIFCSDLEMAKSITKALTKANLKAHPYTTAVQKAPSSWNLMSFKFGPPSVLVAEERSLRPVDVMEADYAIWLDEPSGPEVEYYRRRAMKSTTPVFKFTEL